MRNFLKCREEEEEGRDVIVVECLSTENSSRTILSFAKISIAR